MKNVQKNVIYTDNGVKHTHDERLELCPFCGGYPDFVRESKEHPLKFMGYDDIHVVFVRCRDCWATSKELEYNPDIHKNGSEYDEVAKLWNRRA